VILPGPDYPRRQRPALSSDHRWAFLHIQVATDAADFDRWAALDFGFDRNHRPRGVVEILL
jgi:hypothetical protein